MAFFLAQNSLYALQPQCLNDVERLGAEARSFKNAEGWEKARQRVADVPDSKKVEVAFREYLKFHLESPELDADDVDRVVKIATRIKYVDSWDLGRSQIRSDGELVLYSPRNIKNSALAVATKIHEFSHLFLQMKSYRSFLKFKSNQMPSKRELRRHLVPGLKDIFFPKRRIQFIQTHESTALLEEKYFYDLFPEDYWHREISKMEAFARSLPPEQVDFFKTMIEGMRDRNLPDQEWLEKTQSLGRYDPNEIRFVYRRQAHIAWYFATIVGMGLGTFAAVLLN